ncbi:hypothetical protein KIPB_010874, partial [Kipferlia bialata]|eukprot:g10874.t1
MFSFYSHVVLELQPPPPFSLSCTLCSPSLSDLTWYTSGAPDRAVRQVLRTCPSEPVFPSLPSSLTILLCTPEALAALPATLSLLCRCLGDTAGEAGLDTLLPNVTVYATQELYLIAQRLLSLTTAGHGTTYTLGTAMRQGLTRRGVGIELVPLRIPVFTRCGIEIRAVPQARFTLKKEGEDSAGLYAGQCAWVLKWDTVRILCARASLDGRCAPPPPFPLVLSSQQEDQVRLFFYPRFVLPSTDSLPNGVSSLVTQGEWIGATLPLTGDIDLGELSLTVLELLDGGDQRPK